MKKIFSEPEIEILNFLCDQGFDSETTSGPGLPGGAVPGGDVDENGMPV